VPVLPPWAIGLAAGLARPAHLSICAPAKRVLITRAAPAASITRWSLWLMLAVTSACGGRLNSTAWSKILRDNRSALDRSAEALKSSKAALERSHHAQRQPSGWSLARTGRQQHAKQTASVEVRPSAGACRTEPLQDQRQAN